MTQPRPHRRTDYAIELLGPGVEKGWNDCLAAARSSMVDAWDRLTVAPADQTPRQYRLRGSEVTRVYRGRALPQWEYKTTDGGRLLYLVDDTPVQDARGRQVCAGTVWVVEAAPGHPKRTERVKGPRKGPGRR